MARGLHVSRSDRGGVGWSVRLEPGADIIVGRSEKSDLRLPEPTVSVAHARIQFEEDGLIVTDTGSSNGTFLIREDQETRVPPKEPQRLHSSDTLRIGPYRLVLCDFLGDGVAVREDDEEESASTGAGDAMTVVPGVNAPNLSSVGGKARPGPRAGEDSMAALRQLSKSLQEAGPEASPGCVWKAVLSGLREVAKAKSGYLMVHDDGDFLLRASEGEGCLSRRFLKRVLDQDGASFFVPEIDGGYITDPKALERAPVLAGVRFPAAPEAPIWLGYLECTSLAVLHNKFELELYASVAAPMLELSRRFDLESRRRESLQSRHSGVADGDGAEPRVALVGGSPGFRQAVDTVKRAAGSRANVLVRGPSGAGKEQLAQLAHEAGARRDHPFVVLNCAALPETLIESELFGADKGSYTGADRDRPGAFVAADGGTLFLDEVGDLPLAAQAKILRVIETGEVVRVGGSRRNVDVRLVTATHRNLEQMVQDGDFREDLYYRLRVIEVRIPPLCERREDVLPLVEHFLQLIGRTEGRHMQAVSVRAARCLGAYDWPGNVRELRNVIDRAVALDADGILDLDDLPAEFRGVTGEAAVAETADGIPGELLQLPWGEAKDRFEAEYFRQALERSGGGVIAAAEATGVDRRTLSEKIRRHQLRERGDD